MDYAPFVQRIEPKLPPGAMQTFEVNAPLSTHWRAATCEEVECKAYMQGWTSDVPPNTEDEARIVTSYDGEIRRGQVRVTVTAEGFNRYHFPAGTECFRRVWHRLPLERPAIFTVRSGDWRGTDGVIRQFDRGDQWVDAFSNHQAGIAEQINRG